MGLMTNDDKFWYSNLAVNVDLNFCKATLSSPPSEAIIASPSHQAESNNSSEDFLRLRKFITFSRLVTWSIIPPAMQVFSQITDSMNQYPVI